MRTILLLALMGFFKISNAQNSSKIVIELERSLLQSFNIKEDSGLPRLHVYYWGDSTRTNSEYLTPLLVGSKLKWTITSNKPVLFTGNYVINPYFLAHPGDSVHITTDQNQITFKGKGAARYLLLNEIHNVKQNIKKPVKFVVDVLSVDDYLKADKYFDEQLDKTITLIDEYKNKLSKAELAWIKRWTVEWIEWQRINAFGNAALLVAKDSAKKSGYSMKDIHAIWDSTQLKHWSTWLRNQHDYNNYTAPLYFYHFNRTEVWLRFDFDLKNDSLFSKPIRTYLYYEGIKKNYKGLVRERVMHHLIDEQVIMEMGSQHLMTKQILNDYYNLPGFPTYRSWIKSLENRHRYGRDNVAPAFSLTDTNGNIFKSDQIKRKIAVLDFWFTGCKGCIQMAPALKKVEAYFKGDTNVVFIGISTDTNKDRWLKSVSESKYTSGQGIQLYTSGQGAAHPIIKQYSIGSYPTLAIIDPYGKLVTTYPPPDARMDNGMSLIKVIQQQLLRLKDGPYVFAESDILKAYTINSNSLVKNQGNINSLVNIKVATDKYDKSLDVKLMLNLASPPSKYPKPGKILVLSDIEGNFAALKQLLQSNGVIDSNYNWTFGDGHLVFAGDMFDRGEYVTECLWLIYSLEEKAKINGGVVHFILGNHEIMNLQGNHKYTHEKYFHNARLLKKQVRELYDSTNILGRWLRTKNVMEQLGDILILHAGVSPGLYNLPLDIGEINEVARQHYNTPIEKTANYTAREIMGQNGPFWYRGYFNNDKIDSEIKNEITKTLAKFNVRQIITGHTIVADTISVHHSGAVINTDTHHAAGMSEALLIQNAEYYRVNAFGQRKLLYVRPENREFNTSKNKKSH